MSVKVPSQERNVKEVGTAFITREIGFILLVIFGAARPVLRYDGIEAQIGPVNVGGTARQY